MWKILKFIGFLVKTAFWLALLLALAGLVVLYLLEQNVPAPLVARLSDALSTDDILCRVGRATFSLRNGARLYQVKAFPKRSAGDALVAADEIDVEFSLDPSASLGERLTGVTLKNLSLPGLPRKAKGDDDKKGEAKPPPANPLAPEPTVRPPPPKLPRIAAFPLTLENADVLGLKAERLSASVAVEDAQLVVRDVSIHWPDRAFDMTVNGWVTVDFAKRLVTGNAKGQAFPANILPLLEALHSKGAIRQINYFSKIEKPVNASADFCVDMDNSDFSLALDLDVGTCAYRDVPMKFARGPLYAYGTNIYTTVAVGPIQAESSTGPLAGRITYREQNESVEIDATANMDIEQLATIIDILRHNELRHVRCSQPVSASARGVVAADRRKSTVTNDLSGTIAMPAGAILKLPVKDVTADFAVKGDSALFENVRGCSASGGKISGEIGFFYPGGAATATLFSARATFSGVQLADLSPVFGFSESRQGHVAGNVSLVGRATERTLATLNGEGALRVSDSVISRTPLFAGFTDYLARNIPGVSSLVNQSAGSMDFTIEDGVLHTESLLIEGDLFSMRGRGTCNLEKESLDFTMRANIFKEKTFAGRITHLVTLPFTRLLLEFKVFGTFDKTEWSYVNIIEKITDGLSDIPKSFRSTPEKSKPDGH